MPLSTEQTKKLFDYCKDALESAAWLAPNPDEKEPEYTQRVLGPLLKEIVDSTNHQGLVVRYDGSLTPQPVLFGISNHFPDLAVNFYSERIGAVEVKYFDEFQSGQAYLTAFGQSVLYSSLGYAWSIVVLVAKNSNATISNTSIEKINMKLYAINNYLVCKSLI